MSSTQDSRLLQKNAGLANNQTGWDYGEFIQRFTLEGSTYCLLVPSVQILRSMGYASIPVTQLTHAAFDKIPLKSQMTFSSLSWADAFNLLKRKAPVVQLSSQEQYFPASVDAFMADSHMSYTINSVPDMFDPRISDVVNDNNIIGQTFNGEKSCFDLAYPQHTAFYLELNNKGTVGVGNKPASGTKINAPMYAFIVDRPTNGVLYRDLVYCFFYAYNGGVSGGQHEGDWEHIVVRIHADTEVVLAVYFQAHSSSDPYSRWYYPPGTFPQNNNPPDNIAMADWNNEYLLDPHTQRILVYSACETHASYPRIASYEYGGPRPTETPDAYYSWSPADGHTDEHGNAVENIIVIDPLLQNWALYSGSWGDSDSLFGNSPVSPLNQGFHTMPAITNSPANRTTITLTKALASDRINRVSENFALLAQHDFKWTIVSPNDACTISFKIQIDVPKWPDKYAHSGYISNQTYTPVGSITAFSKLYICDLVATTNSGGSISMYTDGDVFNELNVETLTVYADVAG